MHALHSSPIGGHSGFLVTYTRIKKLFSWPQMKKHIQAFVASCSICQQAKTERVHYPGLLQPLAVPDQAWQIVSLDFIEGLPPSLSFNCILVVVDKYSHFIKLKHPFTALKVAQLFLDNIYKLHGMPQAIISDRDKVFTSLLWQELFRLSGTELRMSSAYHPQTDGQTERVNQSVEAYLRCFIQACPSQWSKWLSLAEFWYNTNYHSSLTKSPFEILYGQEPRYFGITGVPVCTNSDLEAWLKERDQIADILKWQLTRVQHRMKQQADKKRSERSFAVGDRVWLKLQPYVQTSVAPRANHKLSFHYFGPYEVESKIGSVAYKLKLPEHSSVHPVFHVSLLKRAIGNTTLVSSTLPPDTTSMQEPECILDRHLKNKGRRTISQLLIQWVGWPPELATWEDEDQVRHLLPSTTACGQAVSQGGKNVTNLIKASPRPMREKRPNARVAGPNWTK